MEIYADYAATTPVKPEVVDAMMMIYNSHYVIHHQYMLREEMRVNI